MVHGVCVCVRMCVCVATLTPCYYKEHCLLRRRVTFVQTIVIKRWPVTTCYEDFGVAIGQLIG